VGLFDPQDVWVGVKSKFGPIRFSDGGDGCATLLLLFFSFLPPALLILQEWTVEALTWSNRSWLTWHSQ
jgi:hypothetical protein